MSKWACALIGGIGVALAWLPLNVALERTPDSADYIAIARNLANGAGYYTAEKKIAAHRSPVYPVLLSCIYDLHEDEWERRIIWLHRVFAFLIGGLLVLHGAERFGRVGLACGLIATVLVSASDELRFSGVQILTELPATVFLLLAILPMNWVARGSPKREFINAICHVALFMTRSALVFCSVAYGICLVWNAVRHRQTGAWKRSFVFGGSCTLAIATWSVYLWSATGTFVILTTTGLSNMAAGLSPSSVAKVTGLPTPTTDLEIEAFWTAAPGLTAEESTACIRQGLSAPVEALKLVATKFKIAFARVTNGVFFLGVCGFALQYLGLMAAEPLQRCSTETWREHLKFRTAQTAYYAGFAICTIGVCGLSHPILKAGIVICALTVAVIRDMRIVPGCHARHELGSDSQSIVIVVFGFAMMTITAFGLPRFTRPFLPHFYLSAVMCAPLALSLFARSRMLNGGSSCVLSVEAAVMPSIGAEIPTPDRFNGC